MKRDLLRQIFDKYSNTKFHENPSCGSRVVASGRTDGRHVEANSRFSQFGERIYKLKKNTIQKIATVLPIFAHFYEISQQYNACLHQQTAL
jgi:hypothetical protein